MATGYTADIANDISFEDFALGCASAFVNSAFVNYDGSTTKPELQVFDEAYYMESILTSEAELGAIKTMDRQQREDYGKELKDEHIATAQKYFNDRVLLKNKYDDMIIKVQAWMLPTNEHANLKKFMLDQINDSSHYDCDTAYWLEHLTKASNADILKLVDEKIKELVTVIATTEEAMNKESRRVEETNRWISSLYGSLGIQYDAAD